MDVLFNSIKINHNRNLFLADPTSSKLGHNIISAAIDMIDEIGFEKFTFKKLGIEIESPEASIYRYFKNKNQLLTYIMSWYWGWMEYRLVFSTINIISAELRLQKALQLITMDIDKKTIIEGININKLIRIVISESSKSYLSKDVTKSNKEGAFENYKHFVSRVADIIKEINPHYKYPNMLLSTIIEGAHLQVYFAEHLPRLTNKQKSHDYIYQFYLNLVSQSIKSNP